MKIDFSLKNQNNKYEFFFKFKHQKSLNFKKQFLNALIKPIKVKNL